MPALAEPEARLLSSSAGQRMGSGALVLGAALFVTGFGRPTLVQNVVVGDLVVLALIGLFVVHVLIGTSAVTDVVARLAPGWFLIAVGSLVASLSVGLTSWVVDDLGRDVAVTLSFLAAIDVARRDGCAALRAAGRGIAAAVVIVSGQLVLLPSVELRAQATFPNPNVAGHFLATCILGMWALPLHRGTKVVVTAIGLLGCLQTSSFGALVQLTAGIGFLLLSRLRTALAARPHAFVTIVLGGLAIGALGIGLALDSLPEETETTAFSSDRLDRSATGRFDLWGQGLVLLADHPLGVGPASTHGLDLLDGERELHNQPLAYLVERGAVAFAGLVVLAVALWRLAPAGTISRALLVGFAAQSLLRETSHYRHLWLVLAVALVADRGRARRDCAA